MLAAGCVLVGSAFRLTIQTVGHVHYLPMLAAVMATALVAQRPATFTAIVLSVIADMLILPRQGIANAVVHAALFVAVALVMAEVCHRLASRSALLDSILASVPVVTLNGEGRILRITRPPPICSASRLKRPYLAPSAPSPPILTRPRSPP